MACSLKLSTRAFVAISSSPATFIVDFNISVDEFGDSSPIGY